MESICELKKSNVQIRRQNYNFRTPEIENMTVILGQRE